MSSEPSPEKFHALALLLSFENEIRRMATLRELSFLIVNDTGRLLPCRQALLALRTEKGWHPHAFSGIPTPDLNAPFAVWLTKALRYWGKVDPSGKSSIVAPSSLPADLLSGWQEWLPPQLLSAPLVTAGNEPLALLLLGRDQPWGEAEQAVAEHLCGAYAFAWERLSGGPGGNWRQRLTRILQQGRTRLLLGAVGMGVLFLPVPLSVLAPGSIAPVAPQVVSPPMEGVIRSFHVSPNQEVKVGAPLFTLDETLLRSHHEMAGKALAAEKEEYLQAMRRGFRDEKSKAEVSLLEARVAIKEADLHFTADQLARSTVRAEREGIALFADANDWIGRPVRVGERVMALADPRQTEVEAWVPVEDAIVLQPGAPLRLFLNVAPETPLRAVVYQTAYEPEESPERILSFRIKARLEEGQPPPRIGLKGVAKVYGEKVSLYYYLFRRPLAVVRRWLGV